MSPNPKQPSNHIPKLTHASTGNVSYICPSFHGIFGIPVTEGAYNHTPGFTAAAGTDRAYDLAIVTAKGMAMTGWKILTDDGVAAAVRQDFEDDKKIRDQPKEVKVLEGACC